MVNSFHNLLTVSCIFAKYLPPLYLTRLLPIRIKDLIKRKPCGILSFIHLRSADWPKSLQWVSRSGPSDRAAGQRNPPKLDRAEKSSPWYFIGLSFAVRVRKDKERFSGTLHGMRRETRPAVEPAEPVPAFLLTPGSCSLLTESRSADHRLSGN